jgi:hypothetical protein
VDHRLERGTNVRNAVGGKEEYALVVLEHAQEHRNKYVALEGVRRARF